MNVIRASNRDEWRKYLEKHYKTDSEAWLVFPTKAAGEECVSYNDAVEESLCFGWIDSTNKKLDNTHQIRRFSPRRPGSPYSQPNIERLRWLAAQPGKIMPEVLKSVEDLIKAPFKFPDDIIAKLKEDETVWKNYERFSDSYKRIRIAYIDAARNRPDEFNKRLDNFIAKTRANKLIKGYGGVDKYYGFK